jgi:hypothetical protein
MAPASKLQPMASTGAIIVITHTADCRLDARLDAPDVGVAQDELVERDAPRRMPEATLSISRHDILKPTIFKLCTGQHECFMFTPVYIAHFDPRQAQTTNVYRGKHPCSKQRPLSVCRAERGNETFGPNRALA